MRQTSSPSSPGSSSGRGAVMNTCRSPVPSSRRAGRPCRSRETEPALILDDVFAELDRERQGRLARRLLGTGERQVFITAPRPDELPGELGLEVWRMTEGRLQR
jgi:hypothetical protein